MTIDSLKGLLKLAFVSGQKSGVRETAKTLGYPSGEKVEEFEDFWNDKDVQLLIKISDL